LGGRPDAQDNEVISDDEGDMEDEESDNDGSESSASTSILTASCPPGLSPCPAISTQGGPYPSTSTQSGVCPSTSTQSSYPTSPVVKAVTSSPLVSFICYYYIYNNVAINILKLNYITTSLIT